jgi:hypothetical protein
MVMETLRAKADRYPEGATSCPCPKQFRKIAPAATLGALCRYAPTMQVTALEAIAQLLSTDSAPDLPAAEGKTVFADRFARELARLESLDREPEPWETESLLSALGAAAVEEFELACAFIDAAHDPPAATARCPPGDAVRCDPAPALRADVRPDPLIPVSFRNRDRSPHPCRGVAFQRQRQKDVMMRIILLPAIAGLVLASFSQVAHAADNGQPPSAPQPDNDKALPMDRHGVIRPPEPTTRDPNQAEVPGTRDNPNILNRDRKFEQGPNRPPMPKNSDRDESPTR